MKTWIGIVSMFASKKNQTFLDFIYNAQGTCVITTDEELKNICTKQICRERENNEENFVKHAKSIL